MCVWYPFTVLQMTLPTFPEEERFEIEALAMPGFYRVLCRVGYTERLIRNAAFLERMNQALVEDIRFKALAAKYGPRLLSCMRTVYSKWPWASLRVNQQFLQCWLQAFWRWLHALQDGQHVFMGLCKIPAGVVHLANSFWIECRWSAADIYDRASSGKRRSSLGQKSPAAVSLNKQHANNRSMRSIDMELASCSREALAVQVHAAGGGTPLEQELTAVQKPLDDEEGTAHGSVAYAADAAGQQQLPSSLGFLGSEQPVVQCSSVTQVRRRPAISPRQHGSSCAEHCSASSGAAASLSLGHSSVHPASPRQQERSADADGEDCGGAAASLSFRHRSAAQSGEAEVSDLLESREHGLTFVLSHCVLRAAEGSSLARRLLIDSAYRTLQLISFDPMNAWANISPDVLDIQITYHV